MVYLLINSCSCILLSPNNTLLESVLFGLQLIDLSLLFSYLEIAKVEIVVDFML